VAALADRVLGGAGFIHRTVAICDDEDGERLLAEALPSGWKAERNAYMVWTAESGRRPAAEVATAAPAEIVSLRRALIRESMSPGIPELEETVDELLDLDCRYDAPGGDLWFTAPADDPAAACRLLIQGEVGQIEDVATLESARGRGLAQAVVLAALEHSRAAGHRTTFLTADVEDWPRELYAKLGFESVGEVQILRRH
jgi:GNAT superfamily N-acetyltransferase